MLGIEFVDGDSDGYAADDELVPQPRRPLPRWVLGAALSVLAAGFVVAVATNGTNGVPQQAVATSAPTSTPASPVASTAGARDPEGLGRDLNLAYSSETVLDVAAVGPDTWVLRRSSVSVLTRRVAVTTDVPSSAQSVASAKLAVDTRAGLVWVVLGSGFDLHAVVYRAATLERVRVLGYRGAAQGAAALDGRLYLAVGDRIVELTTAGHTAVLARPHPGVAVGQLVADPSRHRLLAASVPDETTDSRLWAVALPTGAVQVERATHTGQATLAVTAGAAIWLAGRNDGEGVVMALDPRTLAPRLHSTFDPILEPAASVVASGAGVVWVRDAVGSALRCLDATTGEQLQSWLVAGPVASGPRHAVVGYGTRAVSLVLGRCHG